MLTMTAKLISISCMALLLLPTSSSFSTKVPCRHSSSSALSSSLLITTLSRYTRIQQSKLHSSSPSTDGASSSSASSLFQRLIQKRPEPTAISIAEITDVILDLEEREKENQQSFNLFVLKRIRSWQLDELLRDDRDAYIATASFLGSKIPRNELPNVQDVPHPESGILRKSREERKLRLELEASDQTEKEIQKPQYDSYGRELVPDCTIPDLTINENPIEALLLWTTRNIYAGITGTKRRKDIKGIPGLVEEMRTYMLSSKGSDPNVQQRDLLSTLLVLMTPVLPPFYRIFMGWKIPSKDADDPEWLVNFVRNNNLLKKLLNLKEGASTQPFGPAPYAPLLTSWVAPYVFSFLVGPVRYNLRSDGNWGGIVVEKCKFLQESNCKGMCLHSCKIPAQELFENKLGLPLRVSPNFDSQECQWNFGEVAPSPQDDPTWPKGCLVGCGTRETVADMRKQQQTSSSNDKTTEVANCY